MVKLALPWTWRGGLLYTNTCTNDINEVIISIDAKITLIKSNNLQAKTPTETYSRRNKSLHNAKHIANIMLNGGKLKVIICRVYASIYIRDPKDSIRR